MKYLLCLFLLLIVLKSSANGLEITNVNVEEPNALRLTVKWHHSWQLEGIEAPNNHDAVWLFAKYRQDNGTWQHLRVSPNAAAHTAAGPVQVEAVKDGMGIFLSRSDAGSGIVEAEVLLRWDGFLPVGSYNFRVFGVEMVWVPEGPFWLGDGASHKAFTRADAFLPFYVKDNSAINVGGTGADALSDTGEYAPVASIPSAYPKGYKGFYCMKYELGQEQYAGFLNCLTYRQQEARTATSPTSAAGTPAMSTVRANRNGIVIGTPGSATLDQPAIYNCDAVADNVFGQSDDGQNRACNFLSWADLGAYLDWAGLRPITEMEFEKVCRGPEQAKALEFAWGTDASTDANTLHSDGTAQEGVTDAIVLGAGLASHGYAGPQGPLRAGFGGSDTSNRLSIGAAYYGALEMSGNLWEIMVTVDTIGLQFTGNHGNGELDANGNADVQHWPLTNGAGAGHRGGGWNSGIIPGFRDLATSDRFYAGLPPSTRRNSTGGRGGRSGE